MSHNVGHELLDVPFGEMIFSMASAIAESQVALDNSSIEIMKIMGDKKSAPVYLPKLNVDSSGSLLTDDEESNFETSMIGAGFQPTFYQFVETIIEVKMTIKMTEATEYNSSSSRTTKTDSSGSRGRFLSWIFGNRSSTRSTVSTLNSSYTNKYNYSVDGSSLLRTRLVPLPPNNFVQRILDMKAQAIQASFQLELRKVELAIAKLQAEEDAKISALENDTTP